MLKPKKSKAMRPLLPCFILILGLAAIVKGQCRWETVHTFRHEIKFAFTLNDNLYIGLADTADNFWKYAIKKDTLIKKASFKGNKPLIDPVFATAGDTAGYLIFTAGSNTQNKSSKTLWQYKPGQDTWSKVNKFPGDYRPSATGTILDGNLYFGFGGNSGDFYKEWWAYDLSRDTFIQKADFPQQYGRIMPESFKINNRLFISGGQKGNYQKPEDLWEYLPVQDTFRRIFKNKITRDMHVSGNNAYMHTRALDFVYQFDPVTEKLRKYQKFTEEILNKFAPGYDFGLSVNGKGYYLGDLTITAYDPLLPKPTVTLSDTAKCRQDTIQLDAGHPSATHRWSTGATTQRITVNNYGTYAVKITDTNGCQASDTMRVAPTVSLRPDTTICQGSKLMLNAGHPGAKYSWSTGATSQTITVSDSGQYYVSIDDDGCLSSDTFRLNTANPSFDFGAEDTAFCKGNSVVLSTGLPTADHKWQDGSDGDAHRADEEGLYYVTATTDRGCTARDTIQVNALSPPDQPTIEKVGMDSLRSSIAAAKYQWHFKGSPMEDKNQRTIGISEEGEYRLAVVSANGCISPFSDVKDVTISDSGSGIAESKKRPFRIYPNPAEERITIRKRNSDFQALTLRLFNTQGKKVVQSSIPAGNGKGRINVSHLPAGVYQLQIISEQQAWSTKIAVR